VTTIRVERFSVHSLHCLLEWVVHVAWVWRINRSFLNSLQNPTWWRDRATTSMHAWGLSLSWQGLTSFTKCNFPASPASWGVSICTYNLLRVRSLGCYHNCWQCLYKFSMLSNFEVSLSFIFIKLMLARVRISHAIQKMLKTMLTMELQFKITT
jgi:hypothetical protein